MTEDTSAAQSGRTGRPRDPDLDTLILSTAARLLVERGLDDLKVEDVARTAKVGLSTIYRRWKNKEELVVAALELVPVDAGEETGPGVIRKVINGVEGPAGQLFPSLISTMLSDPALQGLVRTRFVDPDRAALRRHVELVAGPSHQLSDADIEWIADTALAAIVYRGVILQEPLGDDAEQRTLDLIQRLASKNPGRAT